MSDLAQRGYRVVYHGPETRCPSCQASSWLVGRRLAECARCACAIPLAPRRMPLAVGVGVGATATLLGWMWWRSRPRPEKPSSRAG